jgi:integrase
VDESGKNTPSLKKLKVLFGLMFDYAVKHEIVNKDKRDMVGYVDISKPGNPNAFDRKPFTKKEVERLWEVVDSNEYISIIIMLIYTGVRISELLDLKKSEVNLEERWLKVLESITDAGIRTVPIAKKVLPFFEHWMNKNDCEYLLSTPDGKHFDYRNYYDSYWKPIMNMLNFTHTPHSTRHTCISFLTAAKVDERFIQRIVGHKGQNVTRQVYTHLEIQELIQEIDKI